MCCGVLLVGRRIDQRLQRLQARFCLLCCSGEVIFVLHIKAVSEYGKFERCSPNATKRRAGGEGERTKEGGQRVGQRARGDRQRQRDRQEGLLECFWVLLLLSPSVGERDTQKTLNSAYPFFQLRDNLRGPCDEQGLDLNRRPQLFVHLQHFAAHGVLLRRRPSRALKDPTVKSQRAL